MNFNVGAGGLDPAVPVLYTELCVTKAHGQFHMFSYLLFLPGMSSPLPCQQGLVVIRVAIPE